MKDVILRFLFTFYFIHLLTFQATVLQAEKKRDELEKILANRREELVGTKNNKKDPVIQKKVAEVSNKAQIHWATMEKLLWRTFLWKDLSTPDNNNLIESLRRLKIMAQGFSTYGSKLEKNKKVRDDLIFALEWIYKNKYNEEKIKQEKEMSSEVILLFSDILVLMEGALSEAQLVKFSKAILFHSKISTVETNAKLNSFLNSELLVAALVKNNSKTDSIVSKINSGLADTPGNEGFYQDEFNISDKTITEKVYLLAAIADAYSILNGTKFQIDKSKEEILQAWVDKEFIPQIFDNSFIDSKSGKRISSIDNRDIYISFLEAAVKIAAIKKAGTHQKETVKYLIEQLPANELLNFDYKTLAIIQAIILDKSILSAPLQANLKVNNNFNRITARRPTFFFGLSLFPSEKSKITKASDLGKIMIVNKGQTSSITSSEIDSLRIPGTTILTSAVKSAKSQPFIGISNFIGGAESDSLYAAVGMELTDENAFLKYKKSWFVFDNEIVALGAGINTKASDEAESIIDQVVFNSGVLKVFEGTDSIDIEHGVILKPVQFIFIQNAVDSLGRGYYFPLIHDVNSKVSRVKNQNSLSFSLTHAKKIKDSHYQYVLLPAISKDSMAKYDSNPDVIVLENNDKLQAVREKNLNIIGANFWTKSASELSVDGSFLITCNTQASLICTEQDGTLELSVSDPTKTNQGVIQFELVNKPLHDIISKDEGVEVIDIEGSKRILFNVKSTHGASMKVKFKLPESEIEN